ncbi:hypothetical protein GCM10020358_39330 [Amorphoplanes nipponensis]|uniref:Uncharacterized protein n=1 Tax=Actinoplanes nipponensis TaxID=135950 RepID=A0A919JHC7_9ACTN|nr:hypothetical protein [Actinoplanes nipponensis]GIE51029.1 hypothetical protein Ani05nite_45630 [Actinoplanes nipponensis]
MLSRKNTAERTAAQAWDYLSSAMAGAGESAKDAGKHTADLASAKAAAATATAAKLADKAGKQGGKLADRAGRKSGKLADKAAAKLAEVSDEAYARANLAANALAGRKPGLPWGVIVGVGLLGVALGWVAATTARAAIERQAENEQLELAESDTVVVTTPTYEN